MVHEDKARKEFASRLALACEKAGFEQHGRQAEIARRMKLTPKAVSKWFNGETIPRREKLKQLAMLIGTTTTYLLGDDEEENQITRYYQELNPRQKIIIDLLDDLPDSETDELLKTLEEKKQKYNAIYEELDRKKKQKAS
jgi:Helix-turn-helix.